MIIGLSVIGWTNVKVQARKGIGLKRDWIEEAKGDIE